MIEFISQPWPWFVAGPMIALVMFSLIFFGESFGISRNLRTMCTLVGAGHFADYFRFDWKTQIWNLVFVLGTIIGAFIAQHFLMTTESVAISPATISDLEALGIVNPGSSYLPEQFLSWAGLMTSTGSIMLILGGVFVGFGTRYASGCTSGHAISGLSNLQLPSLIAVIGFFIGGLIMTHLILPFILTL